MPKMTPKELADFPFYKHRGNWRHKKTGTIYYVSGTAIDCTNERDGTIVVDYINGEARFCREEQEFLEKFEFIEEDK